MEGKGRADRVAFQRLWCVCVCACVVCVCAQALQREPRRGPYGIGRRGQGQGQGRGWGEGKRRRRRVEGVQTLRGALTVCAYTVGEDTHTHTRAHARTHSEATQRLKPRQLRHRARVRPRCTFPREAPVPHVGSGHRTLCIRAGVCLPLSHSVRVLAFRLQGRDSIGEREAEEMKYACVCGCVYVSACVCVCVAQTQTTQGFTSKHTDTGGRGEVA